MGRLPSDGAEEKQPKQRSTWIRYPDMDRLDRWGGVLFRATGQVPYLVGSALERRDFGDVDVRIILDDHVYDALFPAPQYHPQRAQALWSMVCEAISVWGRQETGLPIDFQFQRMTEANAEEPGAGRRNALGLGKWALNDGGPLGASVIEAQPYAKVRRRRPGRGAWVWSGNVIVPGRGRWTCRCDHPTRTDAEACGEQLLARGLRRYDEGC